MILLGSGTQKGVWTGTLLCRGGRQKTTPRAYFIACRGREDLSEAISNPWRAEQVKGLLFGFRFFD